MPDPIRLPPRDSAQVMSLLRWLLIVTFVVLAYFVLSYLAAVLAPILTAFGIAYLLNPSLERLVRRGASRAVGAGLLLVTFVAILAVAITFFAPTVAHQLTEFVVNLPRFFDNLSAWTREHLNFAIPSEWKKYVESKNLPDTLGSASGPLRELASAAVGGIFSVLGVIAELLLVPVFSYYFLTDWPNILRRLDHMIPPRRRAEVREVARDIDRVVAGWVRGQAIVTTTLAILYAFGFTAIGMPLSLPIGLLVGGLTVIPFVGTFVGASVALLVTLADGGGPQMLGMVAGVILVLHLLEAAVLTPKIVGHRVGLSESGALLAVVAGGKLLGFVGVVLAVPIAATTAVLVRYAVRYYEHTSFFGHESDADVVITPAMAMIMPGFVSGARVLEADPEPDGGVELALERSALDRTADDWLFDSELPLGPSGAPRQHAPAAAGPATLTTTGPEPAEPEPAASDSPRKDAP
ncbi:MAG TPA: AI-2E family transporter [Kofleriaceae bacterium]|nr:AI-2E family transporter [Kofleriaceae bacterium]